MTVAGGALRDQAVAAGVCRVQASIERRQASKLLSLQDDGKWGANARRLLLPLG